jgi:hypothetical protein
MKYIFVDFIISTFYINCIFLVVSTVFVTLRGGNYLYLKPGKDGLKKKLMFDMRSQNKLKIEKKAIICLTEKRDHKRLTTGFNRSGPYAFKDTPTSL